jgi:hypothetical protein
VTAVRTFFPKSRRHDILLLWAGKCGLKKHAAAAKAELSATFAGTTEVVPFPNLSA